MGFSFCEEEVLTILRRGSQELGAEPDPTALERLLLYFAELEKWRRKVNLVAAAPAAELLETHFLDSITLLPLLFPAGQPPTQTSLLDVGSGAGFPGLVLKCCRPAELTVTLLEPRQKRVAFLRQVIRVTGLKEGIDVVDRRLEPGSLSAAAWPLITSRAVAAISEFLTLCAPFSSPGGLVICMKGRRLEEELAAWQRQNASTGHYSLERVLPCRLPLSGVERRLAVFRRTPSPT